MAEACSGIRSLLSLTFLSLVYAYFFDRKVWMRWALLIGSIPLCILANSARVTFTGVLSEINTELAQGFFHEDGGLDHFHRRPGAADRPAFGDQPDLQVEDRRTCRCLIF